MPPKLKAPVLEESPVTESETPEVDLVNDGDIEGTGETEPDMSADVEELPTPAETAQTPIQKAQAAQKAKRGTLPEPYVTPIGFAKALSEHLKKEVKPQIVYSYIKNAAQDHPFPLHTVANSNGVTVANAIVVSEGITWWDEHNARVAARRENAAAKAAKRTAPKQTSQGAKESGEVPTTIQEAE